jgi:peptidoglycan/xylan/chitin deacetylase (PgdA/CDA1 family)
MKHVSHGKFLAFCLAILTCACGASNSGARPNPYDAGGSGGSGGGAITIDPFGLPVPTAGGVAKPAGNPGNLSVLNWAGFKAAVSWTFDDAQPSHIAHYAELQAAGVPMTFYISSGNSGESNFDTTWTQAVQDGHELGNHTAHHCHADLTGCNFGTAAGTLDAEIDQCTDYITQHYPQSAVWTMAAPFGDTGYKNSAATRFIVNRGVGSGMIGANDNTDPFNLPCHMAGQNETATTFNSQTDGARSSGKWLIFLIHTITPTDANWYNPVAIGDVTAGMTYGKSFGDVWMGTVANVAAYWMGQKLIASAKPSTAGTDTTWTWTLPVGFPAGKHLRVKVDGGSLSQAGTPLDWDEHGYYTVALDAGTLTLSP